MSHTVCQVAGNICQNPVTYLESEVLYELSISLWPISSNYATNLRLKLTKQLWSNGHLLNELNVPLFSLRLLLASLTEDILLKDERIIHDRLQSDDVNDRLLH